MSLLQVILLHVGCAIALHLVCLESAHGSTAEEFSATEAQAIVDRHNEVRVKKDHIEAADMMYMNWDDNLADMAQLWAEECIWGHGQPENNPSSFSPVGQNLWIGNGNADTYPSGISATDAWYNEVQYYTYSTQECQANQQCGHYTQVVWADTYAVGCGRHFCTSAVVPDKPNEPKQNVWIQVCNYGPGGNYVNTDPYIDGPNCTQCSSGTGTCWNGLCRTCDEGDDSCDCNLVCQNCGTLNAADCTCNCHSGFEGVDCSDVCENRHSYCGNGWYIAQCTSYQPTIDYCPLMCGFCDAANADEVCDDTSD